MNESDPINPSYGVYVNEPFRLNESQPCAGEVTTCAEIFPVVNPVSLRSTPIIVGMETVGGKKVYLSGTAIGVTGVEVATSVGVSVDVSVGVLVGVSGGELVAVSDGVAVGGTGVLVGVSVSVSVGV